MNKRKNGQDVFLLNPSHENYLAGIDKSPKGGTSGCLLFFFIPFILAGLFIIAIAVYATYEYGLLSTEGENIRGTFVSRRISSDDDGDSYYVTYRYVVNDQTYTNEASVSSEVYGVANNGEPLLVVYAKSDPSIATLNAPDPALPIFLVLFSLCWNGFVGVFIFGAVNSMRRWRKLIRHGRDIEGEIMSITGETDSDGDFQVKVTYMFRSPDGLTRKEGKASHMRRDLRDELLPPVGTPVLVRYFNDTMYEML